MKTIRSIYFFGLLVLLGSCEKYFTWTLPEKIPNPSILVGDTLCGGLVFYIYHQGEEGYVSGEFHGLVAAPQDQGQAPWGCQGVLMNTSLELGSGEYNTQLIHTNCSDPNTAANMCSNLVLNGYDDWFLPSSEELRQLFINLRMNDLGNFNQNYYWSSSEDNSDKAWYRYFYLPYESIGTGNKNNLGIYVRAIRKF